MEWMNFCRHWYLLFFTWSLQESSFGYTELVLFYLKIFLPTATIMIFLTMNKSDITTLFKIIQHLTINQKLKVFSLPCKSLSWFGGTPKASCVVIPLPYLQLV